MKSEIDIIDLVQYGMNRKKFAQEYPEKCLEIENSLKDKIQQQKYFQNLDDDTVQKMIQNIETKSISDESWKNIQSILQPLPQKTVHKIRFFPLTLAASFMGAGFLLLFARFVMTNPEPSLSYTDTKTSFSFLYSYPMIGILELLGLGILFWTRKKIN